MGGGCEGAGAVLTPVGATPSGIWVVGRGCEGAGAVAVGATGIWVVPPVGAVYKQRLLAQLSPNHSESTRPHGFTPLKPHRRTAVRQ